MQTFISTFLHGRSRLNRSLSMLGTLALVSISKPLAAQTVATNDGRITGVAVDSIHGGYLRDALVMLSNSSRTTVTDSAGRFRIDSVKPGSYTLTLSHPLLDTMGIRVMTNPFQVTPDQVASFVLAVPSANTAVATKCSAADRKFGDGALTGVVADADSEMPSSGAEVIVAWTDYVLDRQSVSTTPQRRMATVNSDGSFIVCGIPTDLATGVIARRGSDSTAAVPVTFANVLAIQSFHLPAGAVTTIASDTSGIRAVAAPRGAAVVNGRIVDALNQPVKGARIAMADGSASTISGDDGTFHLGGLRSGTMMLTVRQIGFEPIEKIVELRSASPADVSLTLNRFVPVLETVRISALRTAGLERVGFGTRQKIGFGKYVTPEQLERWSHPRLNEALRMLPSLRRYMAGRDECVRYFVDGQNWGDFGEGPDAFLSRDEIGAIEAYAPQFVPAEFLSYSMRGRRCAAVVVWTKWKLGVK